MHIALEVPDTAGGWLVFGLMVAAVLVASLAVFIKLRVAFIKLRVAKMQDRMNPVNRFTVCCDCNLEASTRSARGASR